MKNKNKKILISIILLSTFIVCLMASYAFFQYSGSTNTIKYTTGIINVTINSDTENISVTNMFPMEYDDMLALNLDNKLEFNIEGTNESNKDFYYEVKIVNGDEPEENSDDDLTNDLTRIDSKYINFDIYYHDDTLNQDYYYLMNACLDDYLNEGVIVGKLSNNSSIDNDFIVRLWINDDVIIGNKSTSIYTQEEWAKLFASFKVQVDCDNTYREMKYSYTKKAQDTKTNVMGLYLYSSGNWYRGSIHSNYSDNRKYIEVTPTDEENKKISYYFPNNEFFRSKALNTTVINFNKVSTSELEELKTTLGTDNYYDHTNSLMVGKQTIGYFNQTNDDSDNPVYEYNLVSDGIIVFPEDSANMFELVYNTSGSSTAAWDGMYNSSSTTKSYLNQIEYINFNNIYTGNTTDFGYMFMNHTALKELDLSNFDTHNATRLSGMFCYTSGITELDVSNFDTSRATKIDWMFSGLNVTEIEGVEDLVTNRVEIMDELFVNSINITSLDLSNWRVNNVKHMTDLDNIYVDVGFKYSKSFGYECLYNHCFEFWGTFANSNAKAYNASDGTGSTISIKFGNIFSGCTNLSVINISNWEFDNIESLAYLFASLKNITSLVMDNVDTSNIKNFSGMFSYCNYTEIPFENIDTSNGLYFNYMFNSSKLTSFDFDCLDFSKGIEFAYFLQYSSLLTSVEGSIEGSNAKNLNSLFNGCTILVNLDLDFDTSNVINLSCLFSSCQKIENFSWVIDTNSATDTSYMFNNCKLLKAIDISKFDTSKSVNMYCMFNECNNLNRYTPFDTSKIKTDSAIDISYLYSNCWYFDQTCMNGIQNYNVSNCELMYGVFRGVGSYLKSSLTIDLSSWDVSNVTKVEDLFSSGDFVSIDISGWDLSNCESFDSMFSYCRSLTTLNLDNVSVNNTGNGNVSYNYMFECCESLTILDLSSFDFVFPDDSTSSITTNYMFDYCSSLTSIKVNETKFVNTFISSSTNMFCGCSSITGYDSTKVTADYISTYVIGV